MPTAAVQSISVEVEPGEMTAWLIVPSRVDPKSITPESIAEAARKAGIAADERLEATIQEIVDKIALGKGGKQKVTLAEGIPPTAPEPSMFFPAGLEGTPDSSLSSVLGNLPATAGKIAREGESIGILVPSREGIPGTDVRGKSIPPPKPSVLPIRLGRGVKLSEDGETIVATQQGRVSVHDRVIEVRPVHEIGPRAEGARLEVYEKSDVVILDGISEGDEVRSDGTVVILGSVGAANVSAGMDAMIRLGVIGRGQGHVQAERDIAAKFCEEASITAGRDICISTNIVKTRVHAVTGRIMAEDAAIIGGEARARISIEAEVLGSEGNVPTTIIVGRPLEDSADSEMIDQSIARQEAIVNRVNETIQIAAMNDDSDDPDRVSVIEEITKEIRKLSAEIQEVRKRMRSIRETFLTGAFIRVKNQIHEGVTVIVLDRTYRFDREMPGPIRLELKKVKNVTELVAVNESTKGLTVLKAVKDSVPA